MIHVHGTKNDNSNLLLLGGAAAIAALLLMNRTSDTGATDTSGSGSFDLGSLLGGYGTPTYGSDAPTIYQIPPAGDVNFPAGNGVSLADLMALFGGEAKKDAALPETTAVKGTGPDLVLDTGAVLPDGTVLKKPFVSSSKKDAATQPDLLAQLLGGAALASVPFPLPGAAPAAFSLWGALQGILNPNAEPGAATAATAPEISARSAPAGTVSTSKKDASVFGLSGQYVRDPMTGFVLWNTQSDSSNAELGGFGLSRDPKTGQIVPYQRDVDIYGFSPAGIATQIYDATSKKGNALAVADARYGVANPNAGADISGRGIEDITRNLIKDNPGAFSQYVPTNPGATTMKAGTSKPATTYIDSGGSAGGNILPAPFISTVGSKKASSGAGGR